MCLTSDLVQEIKYFEIEKLLDAIFSFECLGKVNTSNKYMSIIL